MDQEQGLYTEAVTHPAHLDFPCVLCGERHEQHSAGIYLKEGDHHIGDVCPMCAYLGPEKIQARLLAHVAALMGQAQRTLDLLPQVQGVTRWATIRDLVAAELAVEAYDREIESEGERGAFVAQHIDERAELRELWAAWWLEPDPKKKAAAGAAYESAAYESTFTPLLGQPVQASAGAT